MKTKTMNNTIEKWEKGFDKAVEKQWNTGNPYFPNWEGVKGDIRKLLSQAREDEKIDMKIKIGMLRQWLNEDRITEPKKMVTNEMIEHWLLSTIASEEKEET